MVILINGKAAESVSRKVYIYFKNLVKVDRYGSFVVLPRHVKFRMLFMNTRASLVQDLQYLSIP